jgi:hypothetical protein
MNKIIFFSLFILFYLILMQCSKQKSVEPYGPDPSEATYVGSERCGISTCHESIYNTFIESGHAHILKPIKGDQGPAYPFDEHGNIADAGAPGGNTWDDYLYVIGGYKWKANFIKPDGTIETSGTPQYVFAEQSWVAYYTDENKPYDYSCFRCHTTGAENSGEWRSGIQGTFVNNGVQCEACHGKGSIHASNPGRNNITVNRSSELCRQCHSRNPQSSIAAQDGFIQNYQQYNELFFSPHSDYSCNDCHDPHASTVFDNIASGTGVVECTTCHSTNFEAGNKWNSHIHGPTCVDCHMPYAVKSASQTNEYRADLHSHIFKINPDAVDKDSVFFNSGGNLVDTDESDELSITIDFACYGCHRDRNGVGGINSPKTLSQLSDKAEEIHEREYGDD